MKRLCILLLGVLFFASSCESESIETLKPLNVISLGDGISIENKVLKFKDNESYLLAQEKMIHDPKFIAALDQKLKVNGFKSLNTFYENVDRKSIEQILISNTVSESLNAYFRIVKEDSENYELLESIKGNWLRVILNEERTFSIGELDYTFYHDKTLVRDNHNKNTPKVTSFATENTRNLRSINNDSNDEEYTHEGRKFRVKVIIYTGARTSYPGAGGSITVFAGESDMKIKHQRRTAFTWWEYDAPELRIAGNCNSWIPTSSGIGYYGIIYSDSGIKQNTSHETLIAGVLATSINATGTAKCLDGVTRTVSASESI